MEGVPRINMLGFPLKRSADSPDFRTNLKKFISQHYHEDPQAYSQEISTLESLRASAVHVAKDFTGCAILKKYFCQLHYLKSRFPFQEGSSIAISFSWYDVFSDTVHGWKDIDFEMASILYNIGALHSELGTKDPRLNADGMKTSCTHFQCASWAFQHLKNDYYKYFSSDLSSDILSIMSNICLAQAQECILEKSLIDNRKSAITAKVSLQIVDYYQLTRKTIDVILKKSSGHSDKAVKAVKKWRELVEVKILYYSCLSYLYRGLHSEEQSKFGERITFYKAGMEKLTEAIKLAHSMDKADSAALAETLNFTTDVIGTKLTTSEKENEFIYHDKVPALESVDADFKGVSLVKGIPFKFDDPEIAGPDIFARLVPMEAHEASSLYSEEKAKILRLYSSKVEEKDEALDRFLIAIQLDQLDIHSEEMKIPQALIDCCAALSVNPEAVKKLSSLMSKLSGMFHDVEHNIKDITEILKAEDVKEKEFQEIVGKRQPSSTLTEISREVKKYQHAHSVASESNQTLHEAMRVHVANLQILMKPLPELLNYIPSVAEIGEKDENAIQEMKRLRGKIDEMQRQRESLLNQLRESILNDDITKSLVVKQDQGLENVFEEELKKHEKITQILDQNLHAQDNILRALTEVNASYAETRKATEEVLKKRNNSIDSLLGSYDAYNELVIKCTQGVEFYTKLDANVSKLVDRARAACKAREEEREEQTNAIIKTTATQNAKAYASKDSNLTHNPNSPYYYKNPSTATTNPINDPYHNMYNNTNVMNNDPSMMDSSNASLIQQQYEKNMALQQEYEKLQKLQEQIARESSHIPTQQYASNPYNNNSAAVSSQQYQQYTTTTASYASGQNYGLGGGISSLSSTSQQQQQQNYTPSSSELSSTYQAYPISTTTNNTTASTQQYITPSTNNSIPISLQQQFQQPYITNFSNANPSSYISSPPLASTSMTYSSANQSFTSPTITDTMNASQMYPISSSSQHPQYTSPPVDNTAISSQYIMPQQQQQQQQYSYNTNPLLQHYSQQYAMQTPSSTIPPQSSYGSNPVLEESKQRYEKLMEMQNQLTTTTNTYGQQPITSSTYGTEGGNQGMQQQQQQNMLYNPGYNSTVPATSYNTSTGYTMSNQQQPVQPSQNYPYTGGYGTVNNYYQQSGVASNYQPPCSYSIQQQQQSLPQAKI